MSPSAPFAKLALRAQFKGVLGELKGRLAVRLFLDGNVYRSLHNVTLQTPSGTTQIDQVLVSRHGVFVVEYKHYKGWVFGAERDAQWTQSLFGKKSKFQNPLRQNYRHICALADFLHVPAERFHSVVMFWGGCKLNTPLPPNVLTSGYVSYLKSKSEILFTDAEVAEMATALDRGRLPPTWNTHRAHIASLQARRASVTTCPRCGSPLVEHTAKSGPSAGRAFLGCSGFPKCRYARSILQS